MQSQSTVKIEADMLSIEADDTTSRKRTTSSAERENIRPATLKKSFSAQGVNGAARGKEKGWKARVGQDGRLLDERDKGKARTGGSGDGPPSLNMEFRNSLMLPG